MPTSSDWIREILSLIDDSVSTTDGSMPAIQNKAFERASSALNRLTTRSGDLRPTIGNLRQVDIIVRRLEQDIFNSGYRSSVSGFMGKFSKLTSLQTKYFSSVIKDFDQPGQTKILQDQAVTDVSTFMMRDGLRVQYLDPLRNILRNNITAGASFNSMRSQIGDLLTGTDEKIGVLENIAGRTTTDSINTYAAQYNALVTDELGLEWGQYTGSLVKDSRAFCVELVHKRWFHKSEIPGFLKGRVGKKRVPLSSNGLPQGFKPNTTVDNFQILRGGWRCNHLIFPVPESRVPKNIVNARK